MNLLGSARTSIFSPGFALKVNPTILAFPSIMIYDTNSAQYQQFLRSSGRRRDDYSKAKTAIVNKQTAKPAGAASTGL
ncbi:hypothetical protein ABL78_0326 [Leptomonas seymouri]|uniref:Uncharacterized protein n=1 Tax=Leptomonas seymouri TaxID=5684 RepID=A0A0N0P909_LEPSE|nr:hypothetical protein ABL78_0326 [Leptomonas seymouri]|eukprot:KPI90566.1 hypothetical protein ABL78_0326 [Leptomonas seymouri]